jgi:hypothetical protein
LMPSMELMPEATLPGFCGPLLVLLTGEEGMGWPGALGW